MAVGLDRQGLASGGPGGAVCKLGDAQLDRTPGRASSSPAVAAGRPALGYRINAGHPLPLRLRNGRVEEVHLDIDRPFGLQPSRSFRIQPFPLAPGDRFVFVTDGMLERNAAQLDVTETLRQTRDLHPREVVHELGAAVLRATDGDLRDDATVVVLDWYGGPPRRRDSTRGASQQHASP